jgi:hypothetical protein
MRTPDGVAVYRRHALCLHCAANHSREHDENACPNEACDKISEPATQHDAEKRHLYYLSLLAASTNTRAAVFRRHLEFLDCFSNLGEGLNPEARSPTAEK